MGKKKYGDGQVVVVQKNSSGCGRILLWLIVLMCLLLGGCWLLGLGLISGGKAVSDSMDKVEAEERAAAPGEKEVDESEESSEPVPSAE